MIFLFVSNENKQYHSNQLLNILRNIWEIADEIRPVVKLSIVIIFGVLVFATKKIISNTPKYFYLTNIGFAIVSILLVITFIPVDFSRGYGVGLTGSRFDLKMLPIYLVGALLGGIVFAFVYTKLLKTKK